jgi:hypothetical protein
LKSVGRLPGYFVASQNIGAMVAGKKYDQNPLISKIREFIVVTVSGFQIKAGS